MPYSIARTEEETGNVSQERRNKCTRDMHATYTLLHEGRGSNGSGSRNGKEKAEGHVETRCEAASRY